MRSLGEPWPPLRLAQGTLQRAGIGALIGVGTWVYLQQDLSQAWRWILASTGSCAITLAVGWTIGAVLRLLTSLFWSEVVGVTVVWMLVAAMTKVGLGQVADGAATYKLSG